MAHNVCAELVTSRSLVHCATQVNCYNLCCAQFTYCVINIMLINYKKKNGGTMYSL